MFLTKTKKLIFIGGLNLTFLFLFLIIGEFTYRTVYFSQILFIGKVMQLYFFSAKKQIKDKFNWGIHRADETLGFENKENIKTYIDSKKTTTLDNGLRGGFINKKDSTRVLTVETVSHSDMELKMMRHGNHVLMKKIENISFLNGGVGGYGTGQALLKAKKLYPKIKPDLLLVQTLVGHNFYRDILKNRAGFPKPYFQKLLDKIIVIPQLLEMNI